MQTSVLRLDKATIYNDQNLIFSSIDFTVSKGDFVFLIGKTGSGKSSLLKVFYGDLILSQGTGSIVGYDLTKLKDRDIPLLRRKLGIVFQDFKLLPDRTVFENLLFVLKATGWNDHSQINERIADVLKQVNVINSEKKFPFELSGGEQQRIAIARALLNHPEIILADEPTGNLDPETSQEIMQLFRNLHQSGISIIMATHDYNMIMKFPGKIYQCGQGQLKEVVAKKAN
ncbi:MAG: ATP-binding cassette domain-containing protein [Flavobacteriaceae bacterium]|jgi:cell division transport system ATP-binding protein